MPTKKSTQTASKKKAAKKSASKKKPQAAKTYSVSGEHLVSTNVKTSYIAGSTFGLKKIDYSAVDGQAIFEGDIVLGTVAEMEAIKKQVENPAAAATEAAVVAGTQFRWPDGVVIFRIDASLPNQQRVTDAIQHWETNTNIRFRRRTNETNFVTFVPGTGCSSQVGMRGGEQFITLGAGCSTGSTIHEIGHAVGLWHEQSREDRDNFVIINFANIIAANRHNFNQHITDGDDVGRYDYASIMHYPRTAFAINPNVDTITPRPDPNVPIGQRTGLSAGDVAAINSLYPRKAILGETSTNGPAMTTRGNQQVLLGWTGTGNLRLNFMSSANGLTYGNKVTLNEISGVAPALAVFQNRFVVAWIGVGNNRLNVMQSSNGVTWSNKVTLGDTSLSSPALAVLGNQLFIAWRGVGNNQLNVMRSANGVNWGGKVTLGDTTTSGPGLATLGNRLLLAWRGVGNNQLNVMQSSNGTNFTNKVTLGETTVSKPALHSSGGRAFLTWQGVGNRFLNVLASPNGTAWGSKQTSRETCIDGPVITNLGNRLVWGWTGTDAAHRLNSMLFSVL